MLKSRPLIFSMAKRFGGSGPRQFRPYIGKTHNYFQNLEVRNVIFTAFVGWIVVFEGLNIGNFNLES